VMGGELRRLSRVDIVTIECLWEGPHRCDSFLGHVSSLAE
jgi:hypothetical protein